MSVTWLWWWWWMYCHDLKQYVELYRLKSTELICSKLIKNYIQNTNTSSSVLIQDYLCNKLCVVTASSPALTAFSCLRNLICSFFETSTQKECLWMWLALYLLVYNSMIWRNTLYGQNVKNHQCLGYIYAVTKYRQVFCVHYKAVSCKNEGKR